MPALGHGGEGTPPLAARRPQTGTVGVSEGEEGDIHEFSENQPIRVFFFPPLPP